MLDRLTVKNFALLSGLELTFGDKLNVLSGETGAGKSIIVDCIMLLVGGKYDRSMLRFGTDSGFVEGVFTVGERERAAFADYIADEDDELIIFRKFSADGRNEIRINGRSVNLSTLRSLSAGLIEICGQNEHQSLADPANHIKIIDYYVRHSTVELRKEIAEKYAEFKALTRRLEEIGDASMRARNLDIYKYQLGEIEKVAFRENEEEELVTRRKRILASEKISDALSAAYGALSAGEPSAVELLDSAKSELDRISSYDERYAEWAQRLKSVLIEAEDIADSVSEEVDSSDFSQDELDKLEARLRAVRSITSKYGDYNAVMEMKKKLSADIEETENADERYEQLSARRNELKKELYAASRRLSDERKKGAEELKTAVLEELAELGMGDSLFEARFDELPSLEEAEGRLSASGMDSVEFFLSPNAGQPLKPLVKIISGGELSRLMLALKVVSSKVDEMPAAVFDEIDTGISGKVGQEIAKKLARLSRDRQLLCVTHLPQIAAMADTHFFIDKYTDGGETFTRVSRLDRAACVDEIARLSGSKDISTRALENAAQMKQWSDDYKSGL